MQETSAKVLEDGNPLKEKATFQAQRTIASITGRSGPNGPFSHESLSYPYQRALRIREQQLGPEHPETAGTIHDLARFWEAQGNNEEASVWYARALAVREQALGAHHPKTTETRKRLIALLHTMGQHEEAAKIEATQAEL